MNIHSDYFRWITRDESFEIQQFDAFMQTQSIDTLKCEPTDSAIESTTSPPIHSNDNEYVSVVNVNQFFTHETAFCTKNSFVSFFMFSAIKQPLIKLVILKYTHSSNAKRIENFSFSFISHCLSNKLFEIFLSF